MKEKNLPFSAQRVVHAFRECMILMILTGSQRLSASVVFFSFLFCFLHVFGLVAACLSFNLRAVAKSRQSMGVSEHTRIIQAS